MFFTAMKSRLNAIPFSLWVHICVLYVYLLYNLVFYTKLLNLYKSSVNIILGACILYAK